MTAKGNKIKISNNFSGQITTDKMKKTSKNPYMP